MFGSGGDGSKQFGSKGKKSPSAGKSKPKFISVVLSLYLDPKTGIYLF